LQVFSNDKTWFHDRTTEILLTEMLVVFINNNVNKLRNSYSDNPSTDNPLTVPPTDNLRAGQSDDNDNPPIKKKFPTWISYNFNLSAYFIIWNFHRFGDCLRTHLIPSDIVIPTCTDTESYTSELIKGSSDNCTSTDTGTPMYFVIWTVDGLSVVRRIVWYCVGGFINMLFDLWQDDGDFVDGNVSRIHKQQRQQTEELCSSKIWHKFAT
jgi:hypothetical protein